MKNHDYHVKIVSLHNICTAFRDRRKVSKTPFYAIKEDGFDELEYWKDSPKGQLPTLDDIKNCYIDILENELPIPEEVKKLYFTVVTQPEAKKSLGKGRHKKSITERNLQGAYALTLKALAKFEKHSQANFFPIKTQTEAQQIFYETTQELDFTPSKSGGKSPYYELLQAPGCKEVIDTMVEVLQDSYSKGDFPQYSEPVKMPAIKEVAQFGKDLYLEKICRIKGVWKP